jgi:probable DNA metabolism protein
LQAPVAADRERAVRVGEAIKRSAGGEFLNQLYKASLSEESDVEQVLYRCIRDVLAGGSETAENPLLTHVLQARNLARRTGREVHRMHAFVRFVESDDGCNHAVVDPAWDELPLIGDHLRWAIFDVRRGYALVHEPRQPLRFVEKVHFAEEGISRWKRLFNACGQHI